MQSLSPVILSILSPFSILFSRPVWNNALTLLIGAILCKGKRTVCAALRMMGLSNEPCFAKFHHVLNRVEWSTLLGAKILLNLLISLMETGPLVLFIDETLERRKGPKIRAKGYYRDAVRSSKNVLVKSSGLKWLVLAISYRFPFSARYFALPFMSILEPSEKSAKATNKRHKTTLQWTVQALKQVVRWVKNVPIILVGDGGFASARLAWMCHKYAIVLICRLKLNSRLYDFPPEEKSGKRGRKKTKGTRLISFKEMLTHKGLEWKEAIINGYGNRQKRLKYISATCLWGADNFMPVPIKWVLVVDPEGELDPLPLLSTDFTLSAEKIIELFIRRWNLEVTFEETREHLGIETQRQWSDKAILRTTPILMGLYSIVCLIANRLQEEHPIEVAQTAWYEKQDATFSDLMKSIRTILWRDNLIFRKLIFESFLKNNNGKNDVNEKVGWENSWIDTLIEHLAAA